MNVLVIGNGAREHTIAWKLLQSPKLGTLFVAPGNAGTAEIANNVDIDQLDIQGLIDFVKSENIDLTVVGPEIPLEQGLADEFHRNKLKIFGPTKNAAKIETSKAFARLLMEDNLVPAPKFIIVDSYEMGKKNLSKFGFPVVIKADGLAGGKGAIICSNLKEADEALSRCLLKKEFGDSGNTVVIEEFLEGLEVSVFCFVDGKNFSKPIAACDYKRLLNHEEGPNTGGMGSYSPPYFWDDILSKNISDKIFQPVINALMMSKSPFVGVLYCGLMLTKEGPKVLEFNCRLGDPETQVLLPLLKSDLLDIFMKSVEGKLDKCHIEWRKEKAIGVVLASDGYPGSYKTGYKITENGKKDSKIFTFHAGTKTSEGNLVTNGGRVMTVVSIDEDGNKARNRIYQAIKQIEFTGKYFRTDIGEINIF